MNRNALRTFALVAIVAVLAASPINTNAQSNDAMRIAIPFSFTVGDTQLPAGTYTVLRTSQSARAFLIQSSDGEHTAAVIAGGSLQGGRRDTEARLVFNSYGDEHFLSEIWLSWSTVGTEVKSSDSEERLAQIHEKELVAVVANRR